MSALNKLTMARTALILEQPFFGALSLKLQTEAATWIKTLATDGKKIFYNPEYVDSLSMPHLKGILAHEVMHCALGHTWRRGDRDINQWNEAADYVINGSLISSGFTLPEGMLINPDFDALSVEQAYSKLNGDPSTPQGGGSDDTEGDNGPQDGGENGDQSTGGENEGQDQNEDQDDGDDGDDGGTGGNGGAGNGQQSPDGREVGEDPTGCGGVIDSPAPDGKDELEAADMAELEQEWKLATAQAAQNARAAGKLGEGLERKVKQELEPKADWASLLRQFLTNSSKDDYTWNRPNRRYVSQGLHLPSVYSEKVPPIVIAVDTSCSITQQLIDQFQGELNSILSDVRPEMITVLYCDTQVNNVEEFTPDDLPIELDAIGGGGTYFSPVFEWVEEEDLDPACLVYLTDMENWDEPIEPDYPVLWVDHSNSGLSAPFGDHIILD